MDPTEDLEKLEITLVNERRKIVSSMTKLGAFQQADADVLVDIQRRINAVKSALKDEKSRSSFVYENPSTPGK